ncbi:MAG TPA: LysR family transcriptional regulator [Burkholderiales bacterium]|nr:LysR family transcriptional regulator [Burkholderiales bacterium]
MLRNTLEGIEALAALAQFGTVSEAATRLRLTQSAVTKRLQALQRSVELQLLERAGRRVVLTAEAYALLDRARPLLADLRGLTGTGASPSATSFSLAMADSIAASWGPAVLAEALKTVPDVQLDLHVHRSVLLIENVRLGRYQIGLATDVPPHKDLIHYPVVAEPMVLISGRPRRWSASAAPLITIEPISITWRVIEPLLQSHQPDVLARRRLTVESFSAAIQMVKAGFGDGLVPLGLAREMQVRPAAMHLLKNVHRRVTLLARKTVDQSESFRALRVAIVAAAQRRVG